MASGYSLEDFRRFEVEDLKKREEAYLASKAEYERRARELAEARARVSKETVKPVERPIERSSDVGLSLAEGEPQAVNAWQDLNWDDEPAEDATLTTSKGRKNTGKGRKRRSSKTKKRVIKRRSSRSRRN